TASVMPAASAAVVPVRRPLITLLPLHGGGLRGGVRLVARGGLPRREDAQQDGEDAEWQDHQEDRREQPFLGGEPELVGGVAEEALGEELSADDHVPAHREDADQRQDPRG